MLTKNHQIFSDLDAVRVPFEDFSESVWTYLSFKQILKQIGGPNRQEDPGGLRRAQETFKVATKVPKMVSKGSQNVSKRARNEHSKENSRNHRKW